MNAFAQSQPDVTSEPGPEAQVWLASLVNAEHVVQPFDYWLLQRALPEDVIEAITELPFALPDGTVFDGRRETNNALRVFFSPENQQKFDVCKRVVAAFKSAPVISAIEQTTGTDLSGTRLRIEYCQDAPGFWLEPHTDIAVKKFTMLIYLSDDPRLQTAGTDIHQGPPDFKYVGSAPYGKGLGVIFIPGRNSWHGVGHHPIAASRRSIIVNYVGPEWRDAHELA